MTKTNKENKNVNKVNTNTVNNESEVKTMNKNERTVSDVKISAINSALEVGSNSRITFKNAVKTLKECKMTTDSAVMALFDANTLRADQMKIERAKLYAGLANNPDILKEIKCKNISEFVTKFDLGDAKSTVSEMIKVYSIFYDTKVEYLLNYMKTFPSFTELTELCKVFKGAKNDEERAKELVNFLQTYAPKNNPCWNTCKELRDKIYIYVNGVEPTPKTGKTDKTDKTDNTEKGNADYKSIKSVEETTTKDANSTIKSLKDKGDYTENKVKGTVTITASSVSDFMTALVALAKKQGVKPLSFTGDITFTITGHK